MNKPQKPIYQAGPALTIIVSFVHPAEGPIAVSGLSPTDTYHLCLILQNAGIEPKVSIQCKQGRSDPSAPGSGNSHTT